MTGATRLLRREARGDLPLLVCLAVLVAVLAGLGAVGPVALAGREDSALRDRLATAVHAGPLLSVTTAQGAFDDPVLQARAHPVLSQTGPGGALVAGTATVPDGSSVRVDRTVVTFPLLKVALPQITVNRISSTALTPHHISDAAAHLRYVSGGPPDDRAPAGTAPGIAISEAAAKLTGLTVGRRITAVEIPVLGVVNTTHFTVSGIFRPIHPDDDFWRDQPTLDQPQSFPDGTRAGGFNASIQGLVGAAAAATMKDDSITLPTITWELGLTLGHDTVRQSAGVLSALQAFPTDLTASLCGSSDSMGREQCEMGDDKVSAYQVGDRFTPLLSAFTAEDEQTRELASYAVASLLAVGLVTVLVAVRLLLRRRAGHLALQRSRGASTAGLVLLRSASTTPVVLAAGALGWLLGLRLAPVGTSGSPQPLIALLGTGAAALMVPLLTWQAVREPAAVRDPRRIRRRRGRRTVLELTALLLAGAGTVALRARGSGGGNGVDVQLSLVPVLFAMAAVLVLVRVYPLLLRLLAAQAGRGGGVVAFVGLRRAGQDAPATGLALFVLVITLGTAVFGGLVTRSVADGAAVGAAWSAGGDASVLQSGNVAAKPVPETAGSPVRATVAEQRRGVRLVGDTNGATYPGVALVTVDIGRLAAAEPGSPLVRALSALDRDPPVRTGAFDERIPVLTDASFYAQESQETLTAVVDAAVTGTRQLHVKPTGVLDTAALTDPALGPITGGLPPGTRVLVASSAADRVLPNQLTGATALLVYARPGADPEAAAASAADALGPLASVRVRATRLAELRDDGLARLVSSSYAVCTLLAALFGLLAVALELVLTARERSRTSSYLRTLGLGGRSAAWLQIVQLLPLAVAAAVGGGLVGVLEPQVLGPALSIRQFTGGPGDPALRADYRTTLLLGLCLALLVLGAAAVESTVARARRLGAVLRLGEV
ncbi:hypothetical protein ACEZDB_29145 [Streptacidiphilus sp. N1-3]|uniref:ABC transport system permease protein n=1 Tax=Streptacidiphilus alkalitolerans TaxID=3342712 RepID=A0ABV6X8V5_9ACTN